MKEHLIKKNEIKLKSYGVIQESVPFQDFYGDCECCKNYISHGSLCEGGKCRIHNCGCGYGTTCDNLDLI